ncbi:late secretory pathway protein AVL9 homolog [Antedon mediterranea]|uniref:late secretory pathway protein AVL9 homolog n=1 Tax=Antedon mediterranea TaxID=105859 RepID=UPI003AF7F272
MAEVKPLGGGFILHVVVVGFHHKRGCQVDFSYPPLVDGEPENSCELPEEWKYLPFLALPDGAHNHLQDTIYFHLPALDDKTSTVFGVSCYRQINTEDLISKTDDITRGTVQKSVCILSNLPVYGWIQAKLQLITHAYFEEKDFSRTEILKDLYKNLSLCISSHELISSSQMLIGLDARELVTTFKHKVLVLFKLMLLERRVLFYTSPVEKLCGSLLTLLSLFPGMIQHGLKESVTFEQSSGTACDFELSDFGISTADYLTLNDSHLPNYSKKPDNQIKQESQTKSDVVETETIKDSKLNDVNKPDDVTMQDNCKKLKFEDDSIIKEGDDNKTVGGMSKEGQFGNDSGMFEKSTHSNISVNKQDASQSENSATENKENKCKTEGEKQVVEGSNQVKSEGSKHVQSYEDQLLELIETELYGISLNKSTKEETENIPKTTNGNDLEIETGSSRFYAYNTLHYENKSEAEEVVNDAEKEKNEKAMTSENAPPTSSSSEFVVVKRELPVGTLNVDEFGFPLSIFGKGSICQPYMALQQHDLLQDINVRCFVVGATNILFKQKKHLHDVIVEPDEGKMMILDNDLKRELSLSTADLRFADVIVKSVMGDNDILFDGTGWEGGNEWIRSQFRQYLISLLASSLEPDESAAHEYNEHFIEAWKKTHNYKIWRSKQHSAINNELAGHPCKGQLGVADMKIRLQSAMQASERGRKINNALSKTTVAIGNARSAVSSWFTSLAQEWKDNEDGDTDEEKPEHLDFSQTM